ncbi:DUF4385 domain-containing protein, partial [Rhizobium leguminosarum]|nr:DUF4385 domain-containing protein [Rhizobium leguminosarum]
QLERGTGEEEKSVSARIFYGKWKEAEFNPQYASLKQAWKEQYG